MFNISVHTTTIIQITMNVIQTLRKSGITKTLHGKEFHYGGHGGGKRKTRK
jgi:hypothetical protein